MDIKARTEQLRRRIKAIQDGLRDVTTGPVGDGLQRAGSIYLGAMRRRFDSASRGDGTWKPLAESTKRARLARRGGYASAKRGFDEIERFKQAAPGFYSAWKEAQDQSKRATTRLTKERAKLRVKVLRDRLGSARSLGDEHRIKRQIRETKARAGLRQNQSDLAYKSLGKFSILADIGILKNSLSEGRPGNVRRFISDGIRVGTNIFYAIYHQTGSARLPQRTILVQPDDETQGRMLRVINLGVSKLIQSTKK